jgi:hypothetical protein
MRRHYSTEQYAIYKQEAAEELWGQVRWRTQLAMQQLLEEDSEQQMAEYLGLARYERAEPADERVENRGEPGEPGTRTGDRDENRGQTGRFLTRRLLVFCSDTASGPCRSCYIPHHVTQRGNAR